MAIDYVAGTSMGSIIAALYAAGYTPDEMGEIVASGDIERWVSGKIDPAYSSLFRQESMPPSLVTLNFLTRSDMRHKTERDGDAETALRKEEAFLAYAKVIEFLSMLYPLYKSPTSVARADFSLRTSQIIRYIEKHYAEDVTITEIAKEFGVSASFLSRIFKKEIGIPIHEYLNQYRISKSLSLLKTHSITEVGYICGFCDNSHFISIFKKYIGTTPMQYKKQHR